MKKEIALAMKLQPVLSLSILPGHSIQRVIPPQNTLIKMSRSISTSTSNFLRVLSKITIMSRFPERLMVRALIVLRIPVLMYPPVLLLQ